ncbi:hypothetical protein LXL04_005361 [Taraxacum kok-saghyz]
MSNLGRSRVREDRFYSPPALRRYNQQQQKQLQQDEQKLQPQRQQEKQQQSESSISSSSSSVVTTNLDRFMKHTTPIVTAQHFPKTVMKGWRNQEHNIKHHHPYFILGDLWESLKEWSVYGVGVPLVLNETDSVIQYYVPFLSAIQLYIDPSSPLPTTTTRTGGESDSDSSRATSSDDSYENKISKKFNDKVMIGSDGFEDNDVRNPPGVLIFEYFERALPYHRAPLADKISELASKFPQLKTYRSCDLTQSSWVSIAWYPIYRIPVGPSLQNLDASFLTFHSLSTPLKSMEGCDKSSMNEVGIPLPIFGLAVYKLKSCDWTESGIHGAEKVDSLMHSTENWLRSLDVCHPDFYKEMSRERVHVGAFWMVDLKFVDMMDVVVVID